MVKKAIGAGVLGVGALAAIEALVLFGAFVIMLQMHSKTRVGEAERRGQ